MKAAFLLLLALLAGGMFAGCFAGDSKPAVNPSPVKPETVTASKWVLTYSSHKQTRDFRNEDSAKGQAKALSDMGFKVQPIRAGFAKNWWHVTYETDGDIHKEYDSLDHALLWSDRLRYDYGCKTTITEKPQPAT